MEKQMLFEILCGTLESSMMLLIPYSMRVPLMSAMNVSVCGHGIHCSVLLPVLIPGCPKSFRINCSSGQRSVTMKTPCWMSCVSVNIHLISFVTRTSLPSTIAITIQSLNVRLLTTANKRSCSKMDFCRSSFFTPVFKEKAAELTT